MSINRIFTALGLAVLAVFCLGSARVAMAQSVTGGGEFELGSPLRA